MTEKTTDERIKELEVQINSLGSHVTNLTMDIVKLKSKDQTARK